MATIRLKRSDLKKLIEGFLTDEEYSDGEIINDDY